MSPCSSSIRRIKREKNQSVTFVRSVQKVEPTAPIGRILQTNCVRDVSAVSEQQGTDWSAHVPCKVFLPPTDVTTGHGGQVLKLLSPGAGAAFEDLHGHHRQCPTPPPWPPWGWSWAQSGSGCSRSGSRGSARSVRSPTPRTDTPAHRGGGGPGV